jgi:transketolase
MVHGASSGHPGGSLGCVEVLTLLFFEEMKINPDAFDMDGKGEDLFFLSNGHISPSLVQHLSAKGLFSCK